MGVTALAAAVMPLMTKLASAQVWNGQAGGHWAENFQWTPAAHPNGVGAVVTFNHNTAGGSYNVGLDVDGGGGVYGPGSFTMGELAIISSQATGGFNFSGHGFGGGLIFQDGDGTADINVHQASPLVFQSDITITLNSNTALNVVRAFRSDAPIGGAGSLTKTGGGTATLTGNNTYTGATIIIAGTVDIRNSSGLGSTASGTTVQSGATLALQGGIAVGAEALSLAGSGDSGAGALRNISGNNTYGGGLTLTANSRINSDAGSLTLGGAVNAGGFNLTLGGTGNGGVAGVISGGGGLVKDGSGAWALGAINGYAGATNISAGTLTLSGAGSIASSSGVAVAVGAIFDIAGVTPAAASIVTLAGGGAVSLGSRTLVITNGSTTFNGGISGTGGVTVTGGTQTFSGANTYLGVTRVNGGTLNNTNLITGPVTLDSGTFDNSGTVNGGAVVNGGTFTSSGTIAGGVTLNGGTSTSTGNLSGGVSNLGGILNAQGSISGAVTNAAGSFTVTGNLTADSTFDTQGALTVNASFTGLTTLTQTGGTIDGTGSVTTTGTFSQTGGTTGGTLSINAASFSQSGGATIAAGTSVTSAGAQTLSGGAIAGNLDGSGAVTVQTGTTTVTGDVVNSSSVTVAGTGTLLANGAGRVLSNLVNVDGTLGTDGGALSTSAFVTINGTFNLQGNETIGALAGAGTVTANGGNVALSTGGDGSSAEFSGVLSDGTGGLSLTKNGAGIFTLTGTSTYTGSTSVTAGKLVVNGSIASSSGLTIAAGAEVGGTGVLPATTVNGILAPGNSIGTVTVSGALTFAPGSTYAVEVSPTDADRTNVIAGPGGPGNAVLTGATVAASYSVGAYVDRQYTIVNAAGGLGNTSFAGLTGAAPAGFTHRLAYDANNAYLVLSLLVDPNQPAAGNPVPFGGLNRNQQAVANTVIGFFNANGTLPAALAPTAPFDLSLMSGEISTTAMSAGFDAADRFVNLLGDPELGGQSGGSGTDGDGTGEPLGYASGKGARLGATLAGSSAAGRAALAALGGEPKTDAAGEALLSMTGTHSADAVDTVFTSRWRGWGAAYGGARAIGGDAGAGSQDADIRNWGIAAGFDHRLGDGRVGFGLGGAGSSFALANGLGSGNAGVFNAGLYGSQDFGNAYVGGVFAYGWHAVRTSRSVGGDTLSSRYNAHSLSGRVEAGYRFDMAATGMTMGITPYAAAQATGYYLPAYAETAASGANTFALAYGRQSRTAARTELGFRLDHAVPLENGRLVFSGRAAWAWNGGNAPVTTAAFQALPGGQPFAIQGATPARHSLLVDAGAELALTNGVSAKLGFQGEFSRNVKAYGATAKLSVRW